MRLVLLVFVTAAFAQRVSTDQFWAQRSGLPVSDVVAIRKLAGVPEGIPNVLIDELDARSLQRQKHVLLVETGGGHCMKVHVYARRDDGGWYEVWQLSERPGRDWLPPSQGNGICPQAPKRPSARGTSTGRIVVEVPVLPDPFVRGIPAYTYDYGWDGKTYVLAQGQ